MTAMRVGINATSINDRPSGARQRFVGLYGALFRARPEREYLIYEPSDCRVADLFVDLPNVRGIATPLPSGVRWKRWIGGLGYWRRQLTSDRLDLFEALHLPLIRAPDCPTLLTIHDARSVLPEVPVVRRTLYRHVLRAALRNADHVVTVSNAMSEELRRIDPRAEVTTIYNGIDPASFCARAAADAVRQAVLEGEFLLAVGHFEPRKNYPALLAAMAQFGERVPMIKLAIVGKDGGTLAETRALVGQLGLAGRVHLLHEIDDTTLALLYRDARMLVFPSTYEGFGIPLLEAMAARTPMAISTLPVFRELTEGRAVYYDPHNPAAMAAAILSLLSSPEHQAKQRAYGEARIGDFAFATLAAQLDSLHRRLTAGAASRAGAVSMLTPPARGPR